MLEWLTLTQSLASFKVTGLFTVSRHMCIIFERAMNIFCDELRYCHARKHEISHLRDWWLISPNVVGFRKGAYTEPVCSISPREYCGRWLTNKQSSVLKNWALGNIGHCAPHPFTSPSPRLPVCSQPSAISFPEPSRYFLVFRSACNQPYSVPHISGFN